MAIDKAYIKSEVARRTERNASDVTDAEIKAAVQYCSMKVTSLVCEATTSTVIGQNSYDLSGFPKKFKRVETVRLDEPDNKDPLIEIPSFETYQKEYANEEVNDEPTHFIVWGDHLYIYPTPDAVYTLRLFAQIFERDADDITLPDNFEEALIGLACYYTLKAKGMGAGEEAMAHLQSGNDWLNQLSKLETEKIRPDAVAYNDI